jgi:hypothetical protein
MPQYYFTIQWPDRDENDRHCTSLPDDCAALDFAARRISELKKDSGYGHPGLMMIVTNEGHRMVLSLPFLAACA